MYARPRSSLVTTGSRIRLPRAAGRSWRGELQIKGSAGEGRRYNKMSQRKDNKVIKFQGRTAEATILATSHEFTILRAIRSHSPNPEQTDHRTKASRQRTQNKRNKRCKRCKCCKRNNPFFHSAPLRSRLNSPFHRLGPSNPPILRL